MQSFLSISINSKTLCVIFKCQNHLQNNIFEMSIIRPYCSFESITLMRFASVGECPLDDVYSLKPTIKHFCSIDKINFQRYRLLIIKRNRKIYFQVYIDAFPTHRTRSFDKMRHNQRHADLFFFRIHSNTQCQIPYFVYLHAMQSELETATMSCSMAQLERPNLTLGGFVGQGFFFVRAIQLCPFSSYDE